MICLDMFDFYVLHSRLVCLSVVLYIYIGLFALDCDNWKPQAGAMFCLAGLEIY